MPPSDATFALPRWDMTRIFPSLESAEFHNAYQNAVKSIDDVTTLFDERGIAKQAPSPLNADAVQTFETTVDALNKLLDEMHTLNAYVLCFVTTNSRDNVAQAKLSELQQQGVRLSNLDTRLTAWIGSLDVEALLQQSSLAREYSHMLRRTKIEAVHLMSPAEEELASALRPTGSSAWSRLHGNYTSQLSVDVEIDGQLQSLPMSMVRNLANDPRRELRQRAYQAELGAWKNAAVPIAAALNSIKGATNVLSKRRGWQSPLDLAAFENNVDRPTIDAMMTAAHESFPDFRRYLHAKARALGLPVLAWFDLFAPLPRGNREWSFPEGERFIIDKFIAYSPRMGRLAERAFSERWIDAEPRSGKRDGAFCVSIRESESRVLANFKPSFSSVGTLAHELGHAYHNVNLAPRPPLQRETPMTLAETASIFCERMVTREALQAAEPQEQLAILEEMVQGACQLVVDISSRFMFETRVYEKRQQRELSVDEFNELMLQVQRETYGDGLDPDVMHPYMWAVKQHYYQANFYNFPYTFGFLFGLGLFAQFQKDPDQFRAGYDNLLSSTGMADAPELAARFGIETRTPEFWRSSLQVIRLDIDRFDQLTNA